MADNILNKILSFMDNKRRVFTRNAADAIESPKDSLELVLDRSAQTLLDYINDPMSFIGGGAAITRKALPKTNYMRPIDKDIPQLFREVNGENFLSLTGGNFPFGAPREFYSEAADMALGQGVNKGIRYSIKPSEDMRAKINLNKPGLEKSYLDGMGEFIVEAQPTDIMKALTSVEVSQEAYTGLSRGMQRRLDSLLKALEETGVDVIKP